MGAVSIDTQDLKKGEGRTYTALRHEGGLRAVLGHGDGGEESKGDGGELHFEGCLGVVWLVGWLVGVLEVMVERLLMLMMREERSSMRAGGKVPLYLFSSTP